MSFRRAGALRCVVAVLAFALGTGCADMNMRTGTFWGDVSSGTCAHSRFCELSSSNIGSMPLTAQERPVRVHVRCIFRGPEASWGVTHHMHGQWRAGKRNRVCSTCTACQPSNPPSVAIRRTCAACMATQRLRPWRVQCLPQQACHEFSRQTTLRSQCGSGGVKACVQLLTWHSIWGSS